MDNGHHLKIIDILTAQWYGGGVSGQDGQNFIFFEDLMRVLKVAFTYFIF